MLLLGFLMAFKKIERLEEMIALALEMFNSLDAEIISLNSRIRELESELKLVLKENEKAKISLDKLKQLNFSHRKLENDRSIIRLKVKKALHEIEKMDFS